ncbi:hypothetical protein PP996_gp74 [Gordonia phage SheckWes]|uniref:Uncharacterized protein n=1 Tax=Gordonia phage SheckWes TaxID=2591117 RepID=A0A515MIK8_9CAUD|nr:hypothetical protein PP996_gp74 [Gordonia phage SheckWes]QDM56500.1 hypothetical protein SEA_SHECKWES_74 [Gordonia phage SheckWes]
MDDAEKRLELITNQLGLGEAGQQLERIRQHLVAIGVEPAQDPNCDVADTTIKAIDAMIAAFKQTSDLLAQMYGGVSDGTPTVNEMKKRGRQQ